jgi:DNA-binding transcriptional LysR family regulator
LLKHAHEVIAMINLMRAEMSNYAHGRSAVLRILGNTSAMAQFLPSDIASFQARHEAVRVVLEESWSDEVVRKVRSGEADLGVVVEGAALEGLSCQPYRSDRLAAVVPHDDSLKVEAIAFEALLERDLVGLEAGSTLTRLLSSQAAQHLRPLALRVQVRSFEAVCRAVQAKLGIGILPMMAASSFSQSMQLRVIPLSDAWALRPMIICMRARPGIQTPLGLLAAHLSAAAKP